MPADLTYFVDDTGFSKKMCPDFGPGLHWIEGLVTVPDESGRERLIARVSSQKGLAPATPGTWPCSTMRRRFSNRSCGGTSRKGTIAPVPCPCWNQRVFLSLSELPRESRPRQPARSSLRSHLRGRRRKFVGAQTEMDRDNGGRPLFVEARRGSLGRGPFAPVDRREQTQTG